MQTTFQRTSLGAMLDKGSGVILRAVLTQQLHLSDLGAPKPERGWAEEAEDTKGLRRHDTRSLPEEDVRQEHNKVEKA